AEHQQNKAVGSSWNAAGTWEEKEMGPISRPELESILCEDGFPLLEADGGTRICGTSATVTGESQAYNICGRPRLGFEFEVKVQWKGTFEGEDVEGKMEIKEALRVPGGNQGRRRDCFEEGPGLHRPGRL
ncbi:unnamed protein product, partial [Prorocentrum cordatum]